MRDRDGAQCERERKGDRGREAYVARTFKTINTQEQIQVKSIYNYNDLVAVARRRRRRRRHIFFFSIKSHLIRPKWFWGHSHNNLSCCRCCFVSSGQICAQRNFPCDYTHNSHARSRQPSTSRQSTGPEIQFLVQISNKIENHCSMILCFVGKRKKKQFLIKKRKKINVSPPPSPRTPPPRAAFIKCTFFSYWLGLG